MDEKNRKELFSLADDAINNATDEETAIEYFKPIADFLINECEVVAKDKRYRICNIEFYLCTNKHEDKTTDRNKDHEQRIKWYVNTKKRFTTEWRIDIALGCNNVYFGVLLCNILGDILDEQVPPGSHPNLTLKQLACGKQKPDRDKFFEACNDLKETKMFVKNPVLYIDTVKQDRKEISRCARQNINMPNKYKFYIEGTKPF